MDNTRAMCRLAFRFLQCNMTESRQLTAARYDNNRFQRCSAWGNCFGLSPTVRISTDDNLRETLR
jgi:hypothetical protein